MKALSDTTTTRKSSYANSNTNTTTVTLAAITGERHVIDQIIWSTDVAPAANTSHITVTSGSTVKAKWDLSTTPGPYDLKFEGGLECGLSEQVTVVMVANTAGADSHLTVLYR